MGDKDTSKNVYDSGAYSRAESIREDLADFITQLIPKITVKLSLFGRGPMPTQPKHEYQTDTLPAASVSTVVDGADWGAATKTDRTRIYNNTQIFKTVVQVDGTQQQAVKAGLDSEIAYQVNQGNKIHARSIEKQLLDGARADGDTTTARTMGGLRGGSDATAAAAAPGLVTNDTDVSGSFGEDNLLDLWESISRVSFGDPSHILVNSGLKRIISKFAIYIDTSNNSAFSERMLEGKKRTIVVDEYECDFGRTRVVYDRFVDRSELYLLDISTFRTSWYRGTKIVEAPKLGDYIKRIILSELTVEIRAESHSGRLYGITNY
jgi:hypothetical protein